MYLFQATVLLRLFTPFLALSLLPAEALAVQEGKPAGRNAVEGSVALRSGVIQPARGLAAGLASTDVTVRLAVVQFDAPVQTPLLDALQAAGLKVLYPLPPNAAMVRGSSKALAAAAGLGNVRSVFRLLAAHKVEAGLAQRCAVTGAQRAEVMVYLHEADADGSVRARLVAQGLEVAAEYPNIRGLHGRVTRSSVAALAADEAVGFVDEVLEAEGHLGTSVDYSYAKGIRADAMQYGKNIGVGIIDSGFMNSHTAFNAQSGYPGLYLLGWNATGDALGPFVDLSSMGHGTHVMATMMSRWASQAPGLDGVSPWIGSVATQQIRVVRCGSNTTLSFVGTISAINTLAAQAGVQVINNSWGYSNDRTGANAESVLVDDAVWSSGQLWVFSAGNNGNATPTIGSPAAAKNALAVGNVSNSYNATLALSSSIGPTTDNRFKPEIYATGDQVLAPTSAGGNTGTLALTGTSMAAPHVTAVAATLLDHHPTLQGRPAVAKALLIASAQRLSNLTANAGIGLKAGRVHSERAHWSSASSTYFLGIADGGVAHSATQNWSFAIPAGYERMYVALTWIEPAAPAATVNRVINDIDLYVDQGADGSFENASASSVDNYEFVTVANPAAGTWRFEARGYAVAGANKIGLCVFLEKDGEAPRANPATWLVSPYAGADQISMTLNTASDLNAGVQYFFDEGSGIAGSSDSGWQTSPSYTDTGLHAGFNYSYRAKARDTSASLNETAYSTTVVVNTGALNLPDNLSRTETRIPNRYSYGILTQNWSVVAIAGLTDHDLTLAADPAFSLIVDESRLSGTTRDFIAINGYLLNGPVYVEANYGASDTYRIEAEFIPETISVGGNASSTLSADDVFDLFHLPLNNGDVVNVMVDQHASNADLALFILPPNSNKLARIRCSRVANTAGVGGDETYALTSTISGVWGLLVMNENGGYAEYDLKALLPAGPSITVSPSSRDFGSVLVGGYADLTFNVQNTGGGNLSGSASVSAPFSVASGGSYNLGAGASQNVTIRYSPVSAIGSTQTVTFTGGGGIGRTVTGLGYVTSAPAISVSPPSANFGAVLIGTSATQSLVVANVGAGNLSGSASVASPFALVSGGSYSLGAGATQTVFVRFTPASSIAYNGSITFTGGAGATNGLTGSGYSNNPAAISVTPASHAFGSVLVGTSSDRVFTVFNTGSGTLSGNVTGASAPYAVISGSPYVLGQGQGQNVTIRYNPASVGAHNQNLTFSGGAGALRPVSGTGYTTAPPIIAVSPGNDSFDWVQVGSYTDRPFVVQNAGPGLLNGNASATPPFWIIGGGSYSLASGQSQTTTVRFIPVTATVVGGYYLTFTGGPLPTNCILFGFGYDDTSDYDGDGFADWKELRAGTGIYQPGSYLRTAGIATATNGGVRISWDGVTGKYYRVIRSRNTPLGSSAILTNEIPGASTNTTYLDAEAEGPGPHFYHIELSH
jgi:hypothetical protein